MKIRLITSTIAFVTLSPFVTFGMGQLRAAESTTTEQIHLHFESTLLGSTQLLAENTAANSTQISTKPVVPPPQNPTTQQRIRLRMSNRLDNFDPASQASDDLAVDTSSPVNSS
ncbi:MAG: hypothetical protein V4588_06570, partial [Pseudomonadota bacterium]